MKKSSRTVVIGAALMGFVFFAPAASIPAAAQQSGAGQAATTHAGPIPHTSWDGKPDLTGVWGPATTGPSPNQDARAVSPAERNSSLAALGRLYQPWAREKTRALGYLEDPRLHCGPYGFPRYMNIPDYFLLQIVQAPRETLVFVEYTYSAFRIISTDGSTHPKSIVPSYFGDSVGRWEGDTLVVDVTGFNGKIWLQSNGNNANATTPVERGRTTLPTESRASTDLSGGWITSNALHEVERWRLLDADTLEYQATVEDPKVLTASWTTPKYLLKRAPADVMPHEALCLDPADLAVMTDAAKDKAAKDNEKK